MLCRSLCMKEWIICVVWIIIMKEWIIWVVWIIMYEGMDHLDCMDHYV